MLLAGGPPTASRVLDFGRASGDSLAFFAERASQLRILDAADGLSALAGRPGDGDEAPSPAGPEAFRALFPELAGERFGVVLLWDCLNLLPPADLRGFFRFLREHLHDGWCGHAFVLQKAQGTERLRSFGLCGDGALRLVAEERAALRAHSRKALGDAMAPLRIDHAVLRGDGRQELLLR